MITPKKFFKDFFDIPDCEPFDGQKIEYPLDFSQTIQNIKADINVGKDELLILGNKSSYFYFPPIQPKPAPNQQNLPLKDPTDETDEFFQKLFDENLIEDDGEVKKKESGPKKCTCPPQNFYYNGIGCRCGGV